MPGTSSCNSSYGPCDRFNNFLDSNEIKFAKYGTLACFNAILTVQAVSFAILFGGAISFNPAVGIIGLGVATVLTAVFLTSTLWCVAKTVKYTARIIKEEFKSSSTS